MSERDVRGSETLALALDALERLAPTLVGAGRVWEAQERLTRGMLSEALRRTAGNYTHAAVLLGVKRQAIQQMVARFELDGCAASLRQLARPRGECPS
jgi:transcriptional regulator with GAF, ATPase, and Fis domain